MTENKKKAVRVTVPQIFKYLVAAVIVVYVVVLMIYASGSTKSFAEVTQTLEERLEAGSMIKQDGRGLKRYFGLNSADYEGMLYYTAQSNISAEEVLVICVKEEGQIPEVRDAVSKRLESRKGDFEGYAPEQAALIEKAQITVRGTYVFLAVSAEAEEYASVFAKSL